MDNPPRGMDHVSYKAVSGEYALRPDELKIGWLPNESSAPDSLTAQRPLADR